jgi:acetylornithine deacetylase/succinyl-diaminopimelate desuccinylase-like protein
VLASEEYAGLLQRVLAEIDRDELADLLCDLVAFPSPTGEEGPIGEYVQSWLRKNGLETIKQEVEPTRYNVVGLLRGTGRAASLTYNSHMDTPLPADVDHMLLLRGLRPQFDPGARRDEEYVYGRGTVNDKGPLACHLLALAAIKRSGVRLAGDLYSAAVVGEVGAVPIGPYEGPWYRGKGVGTRFLLTHGIVSDYAIVAEPSGFGISWALPGSAWLQIRTRGIARYTPYTERAPRLSEASNAIVKAAAIVNAVEAWAVEYEQKYRYPYEGGEIEPKVNVGAICGGVVYKPNYSPNACDVFVDVRIPPGVEPLDIKYELQDLLDELPVGARVELILSQRGSHGRNAAPLVGMLGDAYRDVFGKDPEPINPVHNRSWNDLNIYNEQGITAVKCGPGPVAGDPHGPPPREGERVERQTIEQLVQASRLYAAAALRICNQERRPRAPRPTV